MTHGRKLFSHWTNVVSRPWPPPSVCSCERCQLEQPSERGLDTLKFVGRQRSQFSFQTREGNGLDLLQMKHTRAQEGLGNSQFPTITSYGSGVRDDNDQREFIVRG